MADHHVPVPEAPQTIRQNWMPFLTFFLRRIILYKTHLVSETAFAAVYWFTAAQIPQ